MRAWPVTQFKEREMSKLKRVVLGFRGGVDSVAAAVLLARSGFEVVPVVLDLGGADTPFYSCLSATIGSTFAALNAG